MAKNLGQITYDYDSKPKRQVAMSAAKYQAMDRAYCISRMVDDLLGSHAGVECDDQAMALLEGIQSACWELYKRLGGEVKL